MDSSDDDDRRPSPMIHSRKRGWQGEELEIAHQREQAEDDETTSAVAAVDISTFQNHVVGEGYQAKHVVRQRTTATAASSSSKPSSKEVKDLSGGVDFKTVNPSTDDDSSTFVLDKHATAETYLASAGLRTFRKEIEDILNTPS